MSHCYYTGRRQLVCGMRRKDLKYEGDPDLRPIGSAELTLLVRWLYTFALFLNTKVSAHLIVQQDLFLELCEESSNSSPSGRMFTCASNYRSHRNLLLQ